MKTQRFYALQAAVQTGIHSEQLHDALLLYEKRRQNKTTDDYDDQLMFECFADVGVTQQMISGARLGYWQLLEHQSLSGGGSLSIHCLNNS